MAYQQPAQQWGSQPGQVPQGQWGQPPHGTAPHGQPPHGQYGQQQGQFGGHPPHGQFGQPPHGQPPHGQPPQQAWGGAPQAGAPQGGGWSAPPPPITPQHDQLRRWFTEVDTDRSGKVSARELQQCMQRAGYKFSPETCKMMVNMFDRDANGQISFDEFERLHGYIVQMQGAFRQVDKDGSQRLEPREVMDALQTSGYRLSPQTFDAVMKKLDRHKAGSLGFDGYIELCVFIGTVRNVYAEFDVQRTGNVTFNFDQFVYAANRTNFL
eukprot:TRINITY_DN217_c0_g3_i2.p1 TRINITY_DN217_c0_g3~~TRINITY_DN217_c0_g3_i2.p1  ORF type:complete len:287 (-),score=55.49 TRINITY_DN217_c0_g3_i2:1243-2043(-)